MVGVLAPGVWYSVTVSCLVRFWCLGIQNLVFKCNYFKDLAFRALFSSLQYLEFRLQSSSDH
jgi:hypothetical protein